MSHSFWYGIRFLLFKCDAEKTHRWVMRVLRQVGILSRLFVPKNPSRILIRSPFEGELWRAMPREERIGLAAGLDKNAEILEMLPRLGFRFAEIGTVTPRPQMGNPLPRLFRNFKERNLFNSMGFNNEGSAVIADRLKASLPYLPEYFRVGVNIGKNKDTPLDQASEDYRLALIPFRDLVDYVVVNVSSPNTPGLRLLQTREALEPIIRAVREEIERWSRSVPIFLKLAPEVEVEVLENLVPAAESWGVNGWILSNTLQGKHAPGKNGLEMSGGWSGKALTLPAREVLRHVRAMTSKPIVSVGGIMNVDEARVRFELGADAIQIYSAWIFEGPGFLKRLKKGLKNR